MDIFKTLFSNLDFFKLNQIVAIIIYHFRLAKLQFKLVAQTICCFNNGR
jgi:hypothetical protein